MRATLTIVALCALTVFAQQPITVLSPNGGETYTVGDTMHIRWEADETTPLVMLEMSVDDGETWYGVYTSGISVTSENWGDYLWTIPDSLSDAGGSVSIVSTRCLIRVRNYIDQVTDDISDKVFQVVAGAGVRDGALPRAFHRDAQRFHRYAPFALDGRVRPRRTAACITAGPEGSMLVRGRGR